MSFIKLGIIDDHRLFREGIKTFVSAVDNIKIVMEAISGKDFIQQLSLSNQETVPEIVFLDVQMPEMDGIQTALWLKKERPDIKIIILTMHNSFEMVLKLLRIGVNGYLTKNSDTLELSEAIRSVMKNGFYYSSFIAEKFIQAMENGRIEFKENESSPETESIFQAFSEKEKIFLKLACTDLSYGEIAQKMNISVRTVDVYRDRVFKKLNVNNRSGMVKVAMRNGMI